jgi:DNA-binding transcriptional MerR regulator
MGFLINQYQGFSGNAVEMASVATQCVQFLQLPGDLDKINERLVRYYVAEGLVDRPKRVGRDAEYGYVHLLQFLAGRFLVDAGFPMQKVAPYLASLEVTQLEALVMNKTKPNMAELLVASFASPQVGKSVKRKDEDWVILNKGSAPSTVSSSGTRIRVAARPSAGTSESMRYDTLSADLNAFTNHIQSSISDTGGPDPLERIDKLSDQINYLSDSIKQGLSDLLGRATVAAEKERMIFEEQFERMRLVMQEGWAQLRYEIDHERHHRHMQYSETQDKLDRLMAMLAEGKGKEHD